MVPDEMVLKTNMLGTDDMVRDADARVPATPA